MLSADLPTTMEDLYRRFRSSIDKNENLQSSLQAFKRESPLCKPKHLPPEEAPSIDDEWPT
jgi:hypothetical protein